MSKTTARARASARALGDVPPQLAALEHMSVSDLAEKYRELYGEPTRSRNKQYLKKRLAWRIQELAEGGLPACAVAKITELGESLPERWRLRQATQAPLDLAAVPRDPRIPPVGTVLRRVFDGVAHEVTVCKEGFAYAGGHFKTLSGIAKLITGTPWNGFAFFHVNKPVEGHPAPTSEAETAA